MSDSGDVLELVLQQLAGLGVIRARKMFGGQYIYCDDLFIATIHDGTLYFKANANTAPEFIALKRPVFSGSSRKSVGRISVLERRKPVPVAAGRYLELGLKPGMISRWRSGGGG